MSVELQYYVIVMKIIFLNENKITVRLDKQKKHLPSLRVMPGDAHIEVAFQAARSKSYLESSLSSVRSVFIKHNIITHSAQLCYDFLI